MMGGAPADTAAAPQASVAPAPAAAGCPATAQPLVEQGRRIFSGTGNCFACHGPSAAGTVAAPDLTDTQWLDIDGTYALIVGLVRAGAPAPATISGSHAADGWSAVEQ